MKLLTRLHISFQHWASGGDTCPKCGSEAVTLRMTEWIIGHMVENNGRTDFCRLCRACGHEWAR